MSENTILDARAAASTYVIFGLMFGPVSLFSIFAFRELRVVVLLSFVLLFLFIWIRTFRIVVEGDTLLYTSVFAGKRSVPRNRIASARTEIGTKNAFGPMYRLVIDLSEDSNEKPIVINTKVFRREDIRKLLAILQSSLSEQPRLEIFNSKDAS